MTVKKVPTISAHVSFPSPASVSKLKTKSEVDEKRKKADSPWFVKSFNEFCSATALHGYGYIVRKDAALFERYEKD